MDDERRETHARRQARANAEVAVRNAEDDASVASVLAVAYALLDVADAIRAAAEHLRERR